MEDWEKEIVVKNMDKLVANTVCNAAFLTLLQANDILSAEEVEEFSCMNGERSRKAYQLYNVACKRVHGFKYLLKALQETKQTGAAAIFLNVLNNRRDTVDDFKKLTYDVKTVLGKGTFGTVYKGKLGDRSVAVKRLNTEVVDRDIIDYELDVLAHCDEHENIVRCFGSKMDSQYVLILLEMCDMTLVNWVENNTEIKITPVEILRQLTVGLEWLHEHRIIHRDLKPDNILLIRKLAKVKISDFGLSRQIDDGKSYVSVSSASGTKGWFAPEILDQMLSSTSGSVKYTTASDVFALGCVYYYVITDGKLSFGDWVRSQFNIIEDKPKIIHYDVRHGCTQNLRFVELMISNNPKARPSCSYLIACPIFWEVVMHSRFLENLEKMDKAISKHKKVEPCPFHDAAKPEILRAIGCCVPSSYIKLLSPIKWKIEQPHPAFPDKDRSNKTEIVTSKVTRAEKPQTCNTKAIYNFPKSSVSTTQLPKYNINLATKNEAIDTNREVRKDFSTTLFNTQGIKKVQNTETTIKTLESEEATEEMINKRKEEIIKEFKEIKTSKAKAQKIFDIIRTEGFGTIKAVLEVLGKKVPLTEIWTGDQKSLLHAAVENARFEVITYLIHTLGFKKVIHGDRFRNDHTLIHICIRDINNVATQVYDEKIKILQSLLEIRPELIESMNERGETALHVAVTSIFKIDRKLEFINMLLLNKANPNAKDYNGRTPLHKSVMQFQYLPKLIVILLKHKADPSLVDSYGRTFIQAAAYNRNISAFQFHELITYLHTNGYNKPFHTADSYGNTAIFASVSSHFEPLTETLKIFKDNGVDFNATDKNGDHVINRAIQKGKTTALIKTLIEFGVNWRALNKFDDNVLHQSIFHGNISALELFLELGSNVNAQDIDGDTPLHGALKKCNGSSHEIIRKLLKHGANPNIRNKSGKTSFDVALDAVAARKIAECTILLMKNCSPIR